MTFATATGADLVIGVLLIAVSTLTIAWLNQREAQS